MKVSPADRAMEKIQEGIRQLTRLSVSTKRYWFLSNIRLVGESVTKPRALNPTPEINRRANARDICALLSVLVTIKRLKMSKSWASAGMLDVGRMDTKVGDPHKISN